MIRPRNQPKKATGEGFLLLVLLLSVLLTVVTLLMVRHPAAGVFQPLTDETRV
jgi:hypothetical protein